MPTIEEMNAEATIAREERRHLEILATMIAAAFIKFKPESVIIPQAPGIVGIMREAISAAQIIRDEQARAGTEGKAEASEEKGL